MNNKLIFIISFVLFVNPVIALDLSIEILEKYHNTRAGDAIYFQVEIQEPERVGRHDVSLEYRIKKDNKVLVSSKELKAIETQVSFIVSLKIPDYASSGAYFLSVTTDETEVAEASFNVRGSEEDRWQFYFLIIFSSMTVVGFLVWFEIHRIRNIFEKRRKK